MIRKVFSVIVSMLVLCFTIISILAIWEVIDIQNVISKSLTTLLVIFVSSAVVLFIFSVIYKEDEGAPPAPPVPPVPPAS